MNSKEALQLLLEGNERFVSGQLAHPNEIFERRLEVRRGQNPFAVVLACSDSRTPPLDIFDCNIGDLFIIRTAGNVAGPMVTGSIELAVQEFKTPLIMVLGHRRCGAIKMAIDNKPVTGHMATLIDHIRPAVESMKDQPGDLWDNAAKAHVMYTIDQLMKDDSFLSTHVEDGSVKMIGAYYCLDNWHVELLNSIE